MRARFALVGVILAALIGWLIGNLLEHAPGPGGLPIIMGLIGAMIALDALILCEASKTRE